MALTAESALRKDQTTASGATLEHRHFAFIAATIASMPKTEMRAPDAIARYFADACRHTNPRFDRRRFMAACGVKE